MKHSIKKIVFLSFFFSLIMIFNSFAAKYTIANGKDFNTRIKHYIDNNNTSSTPDYKITAFKYSNTIDGVPIDISEDGDSSVLAYIKNNILYYVSDDDIYLNEDASYMFDKFVNIKQIDMSYIDFSKTKKTNFMFGNCKYLININMDNDTILNLNEIEGMFFDCQSIKDLNLYMFNTRNVKSLNSLFYNCKNLRNIYVDSNIWNTKNVSNYNKTYYNCSMLRTNLYRIVSSIDESEYKSISVIGDDNHEGVFKDIDYDYDDYLASDKTVKVDKISETLISSSDNKNTNKYISKNDIQKSIEFSKVNISTASDLYEHHSNAKIGLNGMLVSSDASLLETINEVPILKEETTFVDFLRPKNKSSSSEYNIIVDEETYETNVNGILRPNNYSIDESVIESEPTVNNNLNHQNPDYFHPLMTVIILIAIILAITIGVFVYYYKSKNDSF